jgi:hypothetical protein
MSNVKTTELAAHGHENPDEALRQGVSRAGEAVENIRRACPVERAILSGGAWSGGRSVQLQFAFSLRP